MYRSFGKRLFDLALTVPTLIALTPLLALIALLVRLRHGAPVVFAQTRAGQHGRPFTLYKFRTMTDARDVAGQLLPDAERVTALGRFLRRTSLDELPQLWNVVRGDLSLIGPRPLPVRYLTRYTPEQNRRHEVAPGIACKAVLHGRSNQTWDQILAHDVWYVDHCSFWTDLAILFGALLVVFKREGVERSANGQIPEFTGTRAAQPVDHAQVYAEPGANSHAD